jgi:hypothetical protein
MRGGEKWRRYTMPLTKNDIAKTAQENKADEESRRQRVRNLRGKYAWVKTSSEELAREKQAELEREG